MTETGDTRIGPAADEPPAGAEPPAARNWGKSFALVIAGQAVSLVGSGAVQFALVWHLAALTASPAVMGVAGIAGYLPTALLSPVAGVAADRFNRKFVCMASDVSVGLIALALAFALMLGGGDASVGLVLAVLFLRAIAQTFQSPAFLAMVPQIVPKDDLGRANGWNQMLSSGSFVLGPVVGAALYAAFPLSAVLLSDTVGAVAACVALAFVRVPKLARAASAEKGEEGAGGNPAENGAKGPLGRFLAEFAEGLKAYRDDKPLLILMVAQTASMLFFLPLAMFYPLMTSDYFSGTAWQGSAVEATYAIGMLVSAALFGTVVKVRRHLAVAYAGLVAMGLTALVCGLLPPTFPGWVAFAGVCACMGASANVFGIPLMTYMQTTVAPERLGRAFSVYSLSTAFSLPVGLAIASPIAEITGVNAWFFVAGVGIVAAMSAGFIVWRVWSARQAERA